MGQHRLVGGGEAAGAIVIVGRVEVLDMDEIGRGVLIEQRNRQALLADFVDEGVGPAVGPGDHLHPLRAEGEQLDRPAGGILHDLDEAVAVQQQVRGQRFEQRLPGGGGIDQRGEFGIGRQQRRPADPLGDQADSPLRHRIVEIGAPDAAA